MKYLAATLLGLFILAILVFTVFDWGKSSSTTSTNSSTTNNSTHIHKDTVTKAEEIDQYVETGLKVADKAIETIDKKVEQKQQREKARAAAKKAMWVYQLGAPFDDAETAALAYDKVKSIPGIYVFKKEWNELYLVKDDGAPSREQLQNGMKPFRNELAAFSTSRVEIVDMAQLCSSDKKPVLTKSIKYKADGKKLEAPCYKCD